MKTKNLFGKFFSLFVAVVFLSSCAKQGPDEDDEKSALPAAPQRASVVNGEVVIKLRPEEVSRLGLQTTTVAASRQRARQPAIGAIMDLQPLFESAAAWAEAESQATKAAAAFSASAAEFERIKKLQAGEQNISAKDFESAQAAWQADEAAARAAQTVLEARRAALAQQWGSVLAGWLEKNTSEYQQLAKGETLLARIASPAGARLAEPPAEAELLRPDKRWITAQLVSAAPQAAPEFQSENYFFTVQPGGGLRPGLNVDALLPDAVASEQDGTNIPDSAVVWWQGRAWIYAQTTPGVFVRREISTGQAEPVGGYFVEGFAGGQAVVTRGAQILLSEETKPAAAGD